MIDCRNLHIRFGSSVAVDGIDLHVSKGSICTLIGPNGAGKSSTINAISGVLHRTNGDITVADNSIDSDPIVFKKNIGTLPDNLGLFDSLTIAEHLSLTADVHKIARDTALRRINDLIQFFGLEHSLDKYARACSHGTRKKTALAMALLPKPPVLLLDEPFEGVDTEATVALCKLLTSCSQKGMTILLTTHVLAMAERIATQVVVIDGGKIISDTPTRDLQSSIEDHYFGLLGAKNDEALEWLF